MRYFKDRAEAGQLLANKMIEYGRQNCAVLALSEGSVLVGAEIAKRLHASLFLLTAETITLPREDEPIATMSSAGTFTYNHDLSIGQLEEVTNEFRTVLDQKRLEAFQKLNRVIGKDGVVDPKFLKRHVVIVVSDGFMNGLSLDVAADFLKPINVKRTIVAAPIATVTAIDRMHLLGDEIFYLDTVEPGFEINHYFENNDMPNHETVVSLMQNIVLSW